MLSAECVKCCRNNAEVKTAGRYADGKDVTSCFYIFDGNCNAHLCILRLNAVKNDWMLQGSKQPTTF